MSFGQSCRQLMGRKYIIINLVAGKFIPLCFFKFAQLSIRNCFMRSVLLFFSSFNSYCHVVHLKVNITLQIKFVMY